MHRHIHNCHPFVQNILVCLQSYEKSKKKKLLFIGGGVVLVAIFVTLMVTLVGKADDRVRYLMSFTTNSKSSIVHRIPVYVGTLA